MNLKNKSAFCMRVKRGNGTGKLDDSKGHISPVWPEAAGGN
ncbi:hypothetical protein [Paenibacillus sp. VTT E-133291]|nr:hypothetical protein [Paenibacillus sp. VTT E-133291]